MKYVLRAVVVAGCTAMSMKSMQAQSNTPLPDPQQLKVRAIDNMRKSEKDLERYLCVVHETDQDLNPDDTVKRSHSREQEQFFVNGQEIHHTLIKDGHALEGGEAKKEQERVDKLVKRYSDPAQASKAEKEDEKQVDMFIRAQRFLSGRRLMRDGRKTILYTLQGDPNFRPKKLEERFAQALSGRIWMDEETGAPAEIEMKLDHDVKIGGGLLANVHKGFAIHLVQQREPDGVWITKLVEGNGDARAALFLHPRFRFKQTVDKCHLFSVDSKMTTHAPSEAK